MVHKALENITRTGNGVVLGVFIVSLFSEKAFDLSFVFYFLVGYFIIEIIRILPDGKEDNWWNELDFGVDFLPCFWMDSS